MSIPYSTRHPYRVWNNFHGTVVKHNVVSHTPNAVPNSQAIQQQMDALRAVVRSGIAQGIRGRPIGGTWSISNIIEPDRLIIDPSYLDWMNPITAHTKNPRYARHNLWFCQGGARIQAINTALGQNHFALKTSGASDGQSIAGCIATGTHGSALHIGAVHDTVVGIYLLVGADRAVLLQPTDAPCNDNLVDWLKSTTGAGGLTVEAHNDDDLFYAAQVSLGSLGVVFGVVLDVDPLYLLYKRSLQLPRNDGRLRQAMSSYNPLLLFDDQNEMPYHFDVILNPYGDTSTAYVTAYWKVNWHGTPHFTPATAHGPTQSSGLMGLVGWIVDHIGHDPISDAVLKDIITAQLKSRYDKPPAVNPQFPGLVFGPTDLPPGHGTSTEIVVNIADSMTALDIVLDTLAAQDRAGHQLAGGIGLRFIPQTKALLGMNIHEQNMYIELPCIRDNDAKLVHQAVWTALYDAGVNYTCHWGQMSAMNRTHIDNYFGADRVQRWLTARGQLLSTQAERDFFASPLLASVGLTG